MFMTFTRSTFLHERKDGLRADKRGAIFQTLNAHASVRKRPETFTICYYWYFLNLGFSKN